MSVLQAKDFGNLKTHHKMMLGALGALTPSLLNLYASDIEMMLLAPPSVAYAFGYAIRVFILVLYGSLIAFFHQDEQSPMKLFQLGAAAPALITIMLGMGKHGDPASKVNDSEGLIEQATTSVVWKKEAEAQHKQPMYASFWNVNAASLSTSVAMFDRPATTPAESETATMMDTETNAETTHAEELMPPNTSAEMDMDWNEMEETSEMELVMAQDPSVVQVQTFDLATETDFFKQFWMGFIGADTKHKDYAVIMDQYENLADAKQAVKTLRERYNGSLAINLYQLPNKGDAFVVVIGKQSDQLTALQLANKAEELGLEELEVVFIKRWLQQQNRKRPTILDIINS